MIKINHETFKLDASATGFWHGTVEVDLGNGRVVTAKAHRDDRFKTTYVHGFVGRYQTGTKVWKAMVDYSETRGFVSAWFGRDERAGRCNKMQGISYDPEAYATAK